MLKPVRLSGLAAVLCALAGCTTVHHMFGFNPAYPPPSQTGAFDASYYGRARLVRGVDNAQCPKSRIGVAEVGDKRLSFAYAPDVVFNPPVHPDGIIHDTVGPAVLDGRITGSDLVMRVTTPQCETTYELSTIGNRS